MLEVLEDLKRRVHITLKNSDNLYKKIRRKERRLKKQIKLRLNETLREPLVQEIEATAERVDIKITEMEAEFRSFPHLYKDKEIWIHARLIIINERSYLNFEVVDFVREYNGNLAAKIEKKHKIRCTRADEFRRRVVTLVSAITKGNLDKIHSALLKMKGVEAIWEIMGYGGELLPYLPKPTIE